MLTARLISRYPYSSDLNLDYSSGAYLSSDCDYLMPPTNPTQLGYVPVDSPTIAFNETIAKQNVYFLENSYIVDIAIPGYSREDFILGIENNVMTVSLSVDNQAYAETDDKDYYQHEWSYTNFDRSYILPSDANVDQISAVYVAGILSIDIPVNENKNESKRIINIK